MSSFSSPPLFINHSLPPLLFLSVFSDVSPACQTSLSSSCSFLLLCKMIWFTHEPPFLLSSCPRCIFSLLQYSFFSCDTFFIYFSSFNLYSYLCFPVMYLLLSLMLSFLFFLPSIFRLSSHSLNRLTHFLCPPFCLLLVWEKQIFPLLLFGFFQDLSNLSHVCSFWSTGGFFFVNVLVCKDRKNVSLCVYHWKTTLYLCVYLVEKDSRFFN